MVGQLDDSCSCDVRDHDIERGVDALEEASGDLDARTHSIDDRVSRGSQYRTFIKINSHHAISAKRERTQSQYTAAAPDIENLIAPGDTVSQRLDHKPRRWVLSVTESAVTEFDHARETSLIVFRPGERDGDAASNGDRACDVRPTGKARTFIRSGRNHQPLGTQSCRDLLRCPLVGRSGEHDSSVLTRGLHLDH